MQPKKIKKYLLSFTFLISLVFPLVNYYCGFIRDIESFENRGLAKEPNIKNSKLDSFPIQYEKFYNDHFTLRNSQIKNYSIYKLLLFRQSPFPEAITVGNDNWLYQSADELNVYNGKISLSSEESESLRKEFEYREAYLKKRNCSFYLMVVPCKACVHSEHVGIQHYRYNSISMGEQLVNYLSEKSKLKTVNLFKVLKEKRKEKDVYYKMDTHWNKFGALTAANEFFEMVNRDFKAVTPLNFKEVKRMLIESPDLLKMIGNVSFLKEFENVPVLDKPMMAKEVSKSNYKAPKDFVYPNLFEYDRETSDTTKPKLLIISDSFGENIFPYLAENFKRTVRIWDAWQYKLNEEIVEIEKPNIFLLIVHEKNLKLILNFQSGPSKK